VYPRRLPYQRPGVRTRILVALFVLTVTVFVAVHFHWARTGCTDDPTVHGPRSCYYTSGD
jgi:hypothetical protein